MELSKQILSDIIIHMKYARFLPELNRRETWEEIVERNKQMHIRKYPSLSREIEDIYFRFVRTKKVLPSMRSMQFGGRAIELTPNRMYNCCYLPIDSIYAFPEIMFLLLGGSGVGFSVQKHHVEQLPVIRKPNPDRKRRFLIGDSGEGWADAIKVLIKSYTGEFTSTPDFDFRDIRAKGARLVTSGGKAPGPQPLKECLIHIQGILDHKTDGEKLSTIEVYDIVCHIADAVLAGGIRRAALIALFTATDEEMLSAKTGNWWELNPQRGRANNSAMLIRHKISREFFMNIFERTMLSGSGEPGIYFSNSKDYGTNPCGEISLRPFQFCNLVEIDESTIESQDDLEERVSAAAFIGTLQAGYTDFHYLREIWRRNTEKDALLGISMTGIASQSTAGLDMKRAVEIGLEINRIYANLIGINPAARLTAIKPSGTTSLVLGTSSGIHAWHDHYYVRRVRVGKNESIYRYLSNNHPELLEDDYFRPHDTAIITVPQCSPAEAIQRTESPLQLLERIRYFFVNWIKPGYRTGENHHNVSATVYVKEGEWGMVSMWLWENRESYNGISLLPFDAGTHKQAPFESCTKEYYEMLYSKLKEVDLRNVVEIEDDTNPVHELACVGNNCEIQ